MAEIQLFERTKIDERFLSSDRFINLLCYSELEVDLKAALADANALVVAELKRPREEWDRAVFVNFANRDRDYKDFLRVQAEYQKG